MSAQADDGFDVLPKLSRGKEKVQLGVLGAARIVPKALAAILRGDESFEVRAIASRDLERAERAASEWGITRSYGTYAELCDDPDIDAVYIALPVSEHAKHCEMALRAGKHVLCEKPFAMDVSQARHVLDVARANRRLLMEAHHWRYHPLVDDVERLIDGLGELSFVSASFEAGVGRPHDIRRNPLLGPGVTMDFGCYAVQWVNWAVGLNGTRAGRAAPSFEVTRCVMLEEVAGVDEMVKAHLNVNGVAAEIFCDMRPSTPYRSQLTIEGEWGLVHFENPLLSADAWVEFQPNVRAIAQGRAKERHVSPADSTSTYEGQLRAFFRALETGQAPPTAGDVIIDTQRALDALYACAGLPSRTALAARINAD